MDFAPKIKTAKAHRMKSKKILIASITVLTVAASIIMAIKKSKSKRGRYV